MADERDDEIAALKARLAAVEKGTPSRQSNRGRKAVTVLVAVGLLAALGYCLQVGSGPGSNTASYSATAWQPPAGYDLHSAARGGHVGVEWVEPTDGDCRGSRVTCFAMNVVTERDCSRNLYASISLLDASGSNVGWTNDTAKGVRAGEPTRLVFNTYERNVHTARIAEIRCY